MKKIIFALMTFPIFVNAQTNISLIGTFDYQTTHNADLSNLWGYTDELGNEYAIVGTEKGVSILDLSTPSNPLEIFFEPGSTTIWREVKTFGDYAYISTEASDGIMIIDLSPLPSSTTLPVTYFFGQTGGLFQTVHSIFIDENGVLYVNGSDRGNGGVIFYDLAANPTNPPELGDYDNWYVHDCYARGDTLYAAHISDGFFTIVDISNKTNPIILGSQNTPHNFTHNVWLDDTGDYLFTTDEVSGAFIGAYDISDPSDIKEVDRIQTSPGTGVIPHNTYWLNDYVVTSYYRDGVTIHDVQYPNMMVEVGKFDTSPMAGDGFNGAWGVYPFFGSGNLIVSDMEQGLFILGPTYVRGCYLEGNVTDASNSQIIAGATVEILSQNISENTNAFGDYGTGILTPGNYTIRYSKPGYYPDTLFNIALSTGVIVTEDVALTPLPNFVFSGHIEETGTGLPIANAQVVISNATFTYNATTNVNGDFTVSPMYDGTYNITAGKWSYITDCSTSGLYNPSNASVTIALDKGYYDDFILDFGWQVSGDAPTGVWERDIPIGTFQNPSTVNPDVDVTGDCGDYAFVTGNGGNSAGFDDVDSSITILTSPVFDLSNISNPYVNYQRWFYNRQTPNNGPNDSLQIFISNGTTTVRLENIMASNTTLSQWISTSIKLTDFITPTANMQLIFSIADWEQSGGNLLEGGLDNFYITDGGLSVDENIFTESFNLFPNPNNGTFTIQSANKIEGVRIIDISGREIYALSNISSSNYQLQLELSNGVYVVEALIGNKKVVRKMMVE